MLAWHPLRLYESARVRRFRQHRPDITLMDLQMRTMSGIDAITAIRAEFPEVRIVVLRTYPRRCSGDARVQGRGARIPSQKSAAEESAVDDSSGACRRKADTTGGRRRRRGRRFLTQREIDVLLWLIAADNPSS